MEEMVSELEGRGFTGAWANMRCSLIGDLRISELVDEPNHVLSMTIPLRALNRY
jgi:acetamidase/formamidase